MFLNARAFEKLFDLFIHGASDVLPVYPIMLMDIQDMGSSKLLYIRFFLCVNFIFEMGKVGFFFRFYLVKGNTLL